MILAEQLKAIVPGKTYPRSVEITEPAIDKGVKFAGTKVEGRPMSMRFCLQSYVIGMYCAVYLDGQRQPAQLGDSDNKKFVRSLQKDIQKAITRGATVEIGSIVPVKTEA